MNFNSNIRIVRRACLSFGKTILFFMPVVMLFLMPSVTHAWSLGDVRDFFLGSNASAQTETEIQAAPASVYEPSTPPTNSDLTPKVDTLLAVDGDALLPEVGPSTDAPEKIINPNGLASIYIVRSGDSLAKIASMFDVSINTIIWNNDGVSRNTPLKAGQSLVILPISGIMHTVVKGDTLKSIAKKYSGDVDEIASFNDLKVTDKLAVGNTIMIPDGQASISISSSVSSPSARLINAGGPNYVGYYAQPFIVGHKTQSLHGYNGVDYGMPVGSPLYAAASGVVIISKSSGYNGGYGKYVVIQHPNGTQTVYGHMSNPVVSVGQSVTQGQSIGYSGNTGKSTGPHLHFEIRGAKNPF